MTQMPSSAFPALPVPVALTPAEEGFLATLAARAIQDCCYGHPEPSPRGQEAKPGGEISPGVAVSAGVFVTIFDREDLRGCLGMAEGHEPLYEAVPRLARAAASRDIRFAPVSEEELPSLRVEISILGSLTLLPSDIDLLLEGLDPKVCGVYICAGGRTGLLLPQVGRRLGWSAQELLEQVSLKAGLGPDAWKDPRARIFGFAARSFEAVRPGDLPLGDEGGDRAP